MPEATTPRVGRPPRINRELIAEAAHEIGLEDVTMRAVAERLGVGIASLYHHVEGRDDLLRLAAEHGASRARQPQDHGQSWDDWLREWAVFIHESFLVEPGLLTQFIRGAVTAESIAPNIDAAFGLLTREGFDIDEAQLVYSLVSSYAIGAAVNVLREREAAAQGRAVDDEHRAVLAGHDADELPNLRRLVERRATARVPAFADGLEAIIAGIAARRVSPA